MSWPVGKCPNMERYDLFSPIGKQKKIAHIIAGHHVLSRGGWWWVVKLKLKLNSAQLKLELGLSLAINPLYPLLLSYNDMCMLLCE